jgi:hypothetical protein
MTPGQSPIDAPVLDVSTGAISALDLWDGTSWLPAGLAEVGVGQNVTLALPPSALDDGSLYARLQMNCEFWGIADPFPTLRPAQADDDVLELGQLADAALGEES